MRISYYFRKIFFVAAIFGLTAGLSSVAQERARDSAPLSFVFLPLRSPKQLEMSGEQFMDEVINVIRARGHNAVSTRYLRSIMLDSRFGALEACTTSACMNNLVKQVGTRYVVHGSLYSDSASELVAELHIVDVPANAVISVQMDSFNKNLQESGTEIREFTDRILNDAKKSVSKGTVAVETLLQPVFDTVAPVVQVAEAVQQQPAVVDSQPVATIADPSGIPYVNALPDSWAQDESVENQAVLQKAQSSGGAANDQSVNTDAGTVNIESPQVNNDTPETNQQDKTIAASAEDVETVENVNTGTEVSAAVETTIDNSVQSQPSQAELSSPVLLDDGPSVPTDALKRNSKSKVLKRVRISGFGVVALGGLIGGIATNSAVKKSLKDEGRLFNDYMEANAGQTGETYQKYIDQTEKTDAKIRQRTLLYVLSGMGLAACSISFKF